MAKLHHATDEQLMFVGELITLVHRIQSNPRDDAETARDWLSHAVDALADLAGCHSELSGFASALRDLARKEGGEGIEDTDGEEQSTPSACAIAA